MQRSNPTVTPFRQRVFDACSAIPKGKVSTYKRLAKHIDCGSNQAIGQALKHNPFAPEVPCHRVIKTDRSLGGFAGQTEGKEIKRKRKLLRTEGVEFDDDGRVAAACLYDYSEES